MRQGRQQWSDSGHGGKCTDESQFTHIHTLLTSYPFIFYIWSFSNCLSLSLSSPLVLPLKQLMKSFEQSLNALPVLYNANQSEHSSWDLHRFHTQAMGLRVSCDGPGRGQGRALLTPTGLVWFSCLPLHLCAPSSSCRWAFHGLIMLL